MSYQDKKFSAKGAHGDTFSGENIGPSQRTKWKECDKKNITEGLLVYAKDDVRGWVPAVVVAAPGGLMNMATLQLEDGQTVTRRSNGLLLRSEHSDLAKHSRLTEVTPINEATVLECLHLRFSGNHFYTMAGSTVVAINPFKDVSKLYSMNKIWTYYESNKEEAQEPHVYVIANKAYSCMTRRLGKINQSIVVSGESGAGKTVSAKHLLRYLTIVSSPEGEIDLDRSVPGSVVERRVLDSNPLLEAFGNAATPRNDNSSRFGKYIQLQFHRSGMIQGGVIQTYLLEKTRVVHQGAGENNFHIFYQLLSLQDEPQLPEWLKCVKAEICALSLESALVTNGEKSETCSALTTLNAMSEIGIDPAFQVAIFQTLVAILHLTTLKFLPERDGESTGYSSDQDLNPAQLVLETVRAKEESARLLGVSSHSLHYALLNRSIVSGGGGAAEGEGRPARRSVFHKPVVVAEAESRRDCLAMLLYSKLFDWLVMFINHQIKVDHFDHSINLLDIYGFETFEVNSLEQLCINYANERLQQHYVVHFLRDLQTEYEAEGIAWTPVAYTDNKQCVEALDGPTGVFGVLNEDVYLNRRSVDHRVCSRIIEACDNSRLVRKPHAGSYGSQFIVSHYAGEVLYTVEEAVTTNKDSIPPELISLLSSSSNRFILQLFSDHDLPPSASPTPTAKTKRNKTVLTKFKSSLDSLLVSLGQSDVHYIRCIKPNRGSQPGEFDRAFVLHQLRACGTIQTVDICRRGYPARMVYQEFLDRYEVFSRMKGCIQRIVRVRSVSEDQLSCPADKENRETFEDVFLSKVEKHLSNIHTSHHESNQKDGSTQRLCASILVSALKPPLLDGAEVQFGHSKLFLTQIQLEHLEERRTAVIHSLVSRAQAWWRGHLQRRSYHRTRHAALVVQTAWRACYQRHRFQRIQGAATVIQRGWGRHRLRRSLGVIKRSLLKWVRRGKFKRALQKLRKQRQTAREAEMAQAELREALGQDRAYSRLEPRLSQDSIDFQIPDNPFHQHSLNTKPGQSPSLSNLLIDEEGHGILPITGTGRRVHFEDENLEANPEADETLSSEPLSDDSGIMTPLEASGDGDKNMSPNPDHQGNLWNSADLQETVVDVHKDAISTEAGAPSDAAVSRGSKNKENAAPGTPYPAKRPRAMLRTEGEALRYQAKDDKERGATSAPVKRFRAASRDEGGGGDGHRSRSSSKRRGGRRREDLKMGNGVLTCRRLTRAGYRFHVRSSVLKHGHRTHHSYLPHGLLDALSNDEDDEEKTRISL